MSPGPCLAKQASTASICMWCATWCRFEQGSTNGVVWRVEWELATTNVRGALLLWHFGTNDLHRALLEKYKKLELLQRPSAKGSVASNASAASSSSLPSWRGFQPYDCKLWILVQTIDSHSLQPCRSYFWRLIGTASSQGPCISLRRNVRH